VLNGDDQARIRALNSRYGEFLLNINRVLIAAVAKYGIDGIDMPDPITMAIAIDRSLLLEAGFFYVDVETISDLTRGETVVDRFQTLNKPPNVHVGLRSDGPGFKRLLEALIAE
jgi:purine nucleosidase